MTQAVNKLIQLTLRVNPSSFLLGLEFAAHPLSLPDTTKTT